MFDDHGMTYHHDRNYLHNKKEFFDEFISAEYIFSPAAGRGRATLAASPPRRRRRGGEASPHPGGGIRWRAAIHT